MKRVALSFLVIGVACLFGCKQFDNSKQDRARQQRAIALQKQQEQRRMRELRRQLASSKENEKKYQDDLSKLSGRMNNLQGEYSSVVDRLNRLQNRLNGNQRKNQVMEKEIQTLKKEIVNERQARKDDINKLLDQFSKQTADAFNKIAKMQSESMTQQAAPKGSGPAGKGDFYVHTVDKGQTLSAIAAAYKVRVKDILRANRMKNTMIRVGQKLYIPKNK